MKATGALRTVGLFAALACTSLALYSLPYPPGGTVDGGIQAYLHAYARVAGAVIGVFDVSVRVLGQRIIGRYELTIVRDCDAAQAHLLYAAAVVSAPGVRWRDRGLGLVIGSIAIVLANLVRLCALYGVGVVRPSAFEPLHDFAPVLIIFATMAAFVTWYSRSRRALA